MPIVTLELVIDDDGDRPGPGVVQTLADRLGDLLGGDPGSTWLRLRCLPRQHYAENRAPVDASVRPAFVEVLKRTLPEEDALAVEAERVAGIVASTLGRPAENVHVTYLPPGEGRIAFGGRLLRAG